MGVVKRGNNSFSFMGPMGMAYYDDGNVLDEAVAIKILTTTLLGIFMILSLIGNVCTCAVIMRERTMRTATNCYLFNLAVTDMLLALFIPTEIYLIWIPDLYPFGELGCRIHVFLLDCICNCNAFTIAAFTIERFLVVSNPFLRQKLLKKSRVYKIITMIWVISISSGIPDVFYIDLLERKKYVYCYYTVAETLKILTAVEQIVFYVMPMGMIFVLYVLIALKLKSANSKMLRSSPVVKGKQNREKAVKMLAAVAASFFFCWFPVCVLRLMIIHPGCTYEDYYYIWRIVNLLCYSSYLSTVVNPILYSLMSHKFRQAFKDFLNGSPRSNLDRSRRDSMGNSYKTSRITT